MVILDIGDVGGDIDAGEAVMLLWRWWRWWCVVSGRGVVGVVVVLDRPFSPPESSNKRPIELYPRF